MTTRIGKDVQALTFIGDFIKANGFSPTIREITKGLSISSTSVTFYWLHKLRDRGLIDWNFEQARTIRLIKPEGGSE